MTTLATMDDVVEALEETMGLHVVREGNLAVAGVLHDHAAYRLVVHFRPDIDLLVIYCVYPMNVPPAQRARVCEVLARMNYGLQWGACEMDMRDGELRFRTALPLVDSVLVPSQLQTAVAMCVATADRYYPAFVAVIEGAMEPGAAIAAVEYN